MRTIGTALVLFLCSSSTPASAQGGWLLIVPPLNEEKIEEVFSDPKFLALSEAQLMAARAVALKKDAPISEWQQWSAHDTAQDCEGRKRAEYKMFVEFGKVWKETEKKLEILLKGKEPLSDDQFAKFRVNQLETQITQDQLQAARCVPARVMYPASPAQK